MNKFRILSLDGGGVRGAYSAAALAYVEERIEGRLIDHFDLITGTSTGGILAIGLGVEKSAKELEKFYRRMADDIFPYTGVFARTYALMHQLWGAKYKSENLRKSLDTVFQGKRLGDSKRPLS